MKRKFPDVRHADDSNGASTVLSQDEPFAHDLFNRTAENFIPAVVVQNGNGVRSDKWQCRRFVLRCQAGF